MTRIRLRPDLARNRTWPASTCQPATSTGRKAGAPDPRRLVPGGMHHCRCPSGSAVILWRRAHADCRPLGAAARFNAVVVAGKSAVARATRAIYLPGGRGGVSAQRKQRHRRQQTLAQAAPQDAAPAAPAAPPDQTQLLQTIARDLANLERTIEQLKANQQQMAGDNSKAIGELKASQEEMKRVLAKVSEQNPPKTSQALPRHRRAGRSRRRPCASPSGRVSGRR